MKRHSPLLKHAGNAPSNKGDAPSNKGDAPSNQKAYTFF
jgi:hypothetical protein